MVVFGDSLSDSGNAAFWWARSAQTITGNTYIPSQPYAPGTTSATDPCGRRTPRLRSAFRCCLRFRRFAGHGRHQLRVWRRDHRRAGLPSLIHAGQPVSHRDPQRGLAQCALCCRGWRQRCARRALRDRGRHRRRSRRPPLRSLPTSSRLLMNSTRPGPSTLLSGTRPISVARR